MLIKEINMTAALQRCVEGSEICSDFYFYCFKKKKEKKTKMRLKFDANDGVNQVCLLVTVVSLELGVLTKQQNSDQAG